jgi:alkylhydroperoxidase family enzyme
MGHSEMLLAVAGLNKDALSERTRRLADEDWSTFSPAEQAAFAFARKQARRPAAIDAADLEDLVQQFGPRRTLELVWWSCHCHYLTRIADAFQLPLERENVFDGFAPPSDPSRKP